jgi:predicted nucleic acid-binding protein
MKADYLIDTNIFIYAINRNSKFYSDSRNVLNAALNNKIKCATTINNLLEFYAITTDSKRVENPLQPNEANEIINLVAKSNIEIIEINSTDMFRAVELSMHLNKSKQYIFDLIISASMLNNSIHKIITYNQKDFNKIENISAFLPNEISI